MKELLLQIWEQYGQALLTAAILAVVRYFEKKKMQEKIDKKEVK